MTELEAWGWIANEFQQWNASKEGGETPSGFNCLCEAIDYLEDRGLITTLTADSMMNEVDNKRRQQLRDFPRAEIIHWFIWPTNATGANCRVEFCHKQMARLLEKASTMPEIVNPLTGEIVPDDTDAMAEQYQWADTIDKQLYRYKLELREAIAAKSAGGKTRRVRGDRYQVVVEMPDSSWDQRALKQLWQDSPYAEEFLRIEQIGVQKRELSKLRNATGTAHFQEFKQALLGAERPPTAPPRVIVEPLTHTEDF